MDFEWLWSDITPWIAMIIVALVFFCDGLSFVYDYHISDRGIELLLFRKIRVDWIEFGNIRTAQLARPWDKLLSALNLTNRFRQIFRPILIVKKRGWVSKAVLLTPRDPANFLANMKRHLATSKEEG